MKEFFKQLILDFFEKDLSAINPRDLVLPDSPDRIITVIGARRIGKTYLLLNHIKQLRNKIDANRLLYINFENDQLFPFTLEKAQLIVSTYYELFPGNKNEKVYFFFDEIQNIPEWSLFIRRLYDTENCTLFLTGSSSRLLSKEIATSLRGRTLTYELFPLSFKETCEWLKLDLPVNYSSSQKARIIHTFDRYLQSSALPELLFEKDLSIQQSVLHEYANMVIYKDLIERHGLTQHTLIKHFIKFLAVNISNLISINKLFNDFKSRGMSLSKNSLYDFFTYLEDSFIFFNAPVFTQNIREQQRNPRKIYAVDIGLKLLMDYNADKGRLLENIIYLELRRKYPQIFYYKGTQEVDFYIPNPVNDLLINVAWQINDNDTRQREIKGMEKAMTELAIKNGIILIADGREEIIKNGNTTIEIIYAWRWLLLGQI
jgi:uncharacterized protein